MSNFFKHASVVRILIVSMALFSAPGMFGVGFTPTDGGLVVNLKVGDRILLSTMIDEDGDPATPPVEYFVDHYQSYTGGRFGYKAANYLRLIPQAADATEPRATSVWTIDEALTKPAGMELGGIAYTMWSSSGYTLLLSGNFKTQGALSNDRNNANLADVVFVFPTNRSTVTSFDPNRTLTTVGGRTGQDAEGRINGEKGFGFLGLPFREVYWLDIPKSNSPRSYTNASVVGFNTTLSDVKYSNNAETATPGQALYSFADDKHKPTTRTIFRLYILDDPLVSSCPDSYFFAYDEQDVKRYRMNENKPQRSSDSTAAKKIYTIDRLVCMNRQGSSKYYRTDEMFVPVQDSTYFYVGHQNKYCHKPGDAFDSQFKNIRTLQVSGMSHMAPAGAYGRMVADTTATDVQNLDVKFEPAGYFLRTSTGRNIKMIPNADGTEWTTEEAWTITSEFAAKSIKATLFTGAEFSEDDPGADIDGWSEMVVGTSVPVLGGGDIVGKTGWARIYPGISDPNGGLVFVTAESDMYIRYDNNDHFGDAIPDLHPVGGRTTVTVQEARLLEGYTFTGWNTRADGSGTAYAPGDEVDLDTIPGHILTLYAQATYQGSIHVAISFIQDGERYFLTQPGLTPRFARARHFGDFTNVWQGMADANNSDPNYLTTYKLVTRAECASGEYVLDPKRETMHGHADAFTFYEDYMPDQDEYLGLYYTDPNVIISNNTWAGLFRSSGGWPTPSHPSINNTRLTSTHYLAGMNTGSVTRTERSNSSKSGIEYNASANQFDGVSGTGTNFTISGVGLVESHYVILPDTINSPTDWTDEVVFGYHAQPVEQTVWSKLIGKQLMAQMMVEDEIVYFHPDRNNVLTTASELRLSQNYRLTQTFSFIRDARVESLHTVDANDLAKMQSASNEFARIITSGDRNPIDVIYQGDPIDVCDTLRITLRPAVASKIKDYYGRWKTGAPGLHVNADGSRYRDIIVRTKTYHYGPVDSSLVLTPEYDSYVLSPLSDQSRVLNFTLSKIKTRWLLDTEGNPVHEDTVSVEDVTSSLALGPGYCSFSKGSAYFSVSDAVGRQLTLVTRGNNSTSGNNRDTLIIHIPSVTIGGKAYPVDARIPLMQPPLGDDELVWSVVQGGKRYFIMAGSGGLIFREFTVTKNTLYKLGTSTKLIKGSANAANDNAAYITPWKYTFIDQANRQLTLLTEYGVDRYFVIAGETTPGVASSGASTLTYEYDTIYLNSNANFEEKVRLKYGADKWLKFEVVSSTPQLTLTNNKAEASVFSWGYLLQEYNLLNNGNYPNKDYLEFTYNAATPATVQTRYKAYREYSILLDNTIAYCCREDENDIVDLIHADKDWKTNYAITLVSDSRFDANASGLSITTNSSTLTTTVTPSGKSPLNVRYPAGTGPYVNIVDTLDVLISLKDKAPEYRFKDKWSSYTSLDDAHLKIPLIRRTYHAEPYDSLFCTVENDEYNFTFPSTISAGINDSHTFVLHTEHREGVDTMNVYNEVAASSLEDIHDHTGSMRLNDPSMAEVTLREEDGSTPTWCHISAKTGNTVTVTCTEDGIRVPRRADLLIGYFMLDSESHMRFINYKVTVSQPSKFQIAGNQTLIHSQGASGDPLVDGMQQVHENKRILYYYPDQRVELPLRERGFYGWWRWYREGNDDRGIDVSDSDVPDSLWIVPPSNTDKYASFPYSTIGGWIDPEDHSQGMVTMGRYTTFKYPSKNYTRKDPPSKTPLVVPPANKAVVTYVADISNYYDNLPLSLKNVNQVDVDALEEMTNIIEPTLSLREIFELHPWTEMAERMEGYKDTIASPRRNLRYMEDHEIMAPVNNSLILTTEHRYNYDNLKKLGHSESLLSYYMRDDHWSDGGWNEERQDTMIWCAGWDAPCAWYTYNPGSGTYTACAHKISEDNDFLLVPAKGSIASDREADTVYYCLRARSKSTTGTGGGETTVDGAYWFNICRYTVIYHRPEKYGPLRESTAGGVTKALITNDEIEQLYEVLERQNFDFNKPGSDYTVYPHPLPWADASYGYCYPDMPELPHNRFHSDFAPDLPNMGEYGLINKIGYSNYWYPMEQHGGAENGYMIYCDGMSSAGQVAAITLSAQLCQGQKMYFSGYVGNPGKQDGNKSCPNFLFSVQGRLDAGEWEDITSYMTGNLAQSDKWYQIFFPINQKNDYQHFRVRVYNMSSDDDGNDFIIDDMCVFATKPPLIAYQANTTCMREGENDSITHVVLRVDYQGFNNDAYNGHNVFYTVEKAKDGDTTFVALEDGYINQTTISGTVDTVYGYIPMPQNDYEPADSIFNNLSDLVDRFAASLKDGGPTYREGYIYENLDGDIRPVLYVIHKAKLTPDNHYKVRMSADFKDLMNSICAMTSDLKVSNRMALELNGEEQNMNEVDDMCPNTTYDISLRVKGTMLQDNTAPIDINGSCMNDWLLYGDTVEASSRTRYGYTYRDIVKVVKDILRCEPTSGTNANQSARNLAAVNRNVMARIKQDETVTLETTDHPYDVLAHLVNNGFLKLYQSKMTVTTAMNDSIQFVIFPIVGTGSDAMLHMDVEVCPTPVFAKLKPNPSKGVDIPITVGGFNPDASPTTEPAVVLVDVQTANSEITLPIDSIRHMVAVHSIDLLSTNDPNYREGVHILRLLPDRIYNLGGSNDGYYTSGDKMLLSADPGNNYLMRAGYNYTFGITMMTRLGVLTENGCSVGTVPFTVSVVPNYLRWDPKSDENNDWNNPENWIGINQQNLPIHEDARYAPLATTNVVIAPLSNGLPYPELTNTSPEDSVKQAGFRYNICDSIRFMSGTAMGQQQLLTYSEAIVDMSTPQNAWAFRSSPVNGLLSGDIFLSDADLTQHTSPWEVGEFDAHGRNSNTGNASFWLSLYNREEISRKGNNDQVKDSAYTAAAEWLRVTNGMSYPLPPAHGWAIYTRTASGRDAAIRLPKKDDIYYYYTVDGEKVPELYEQNLRAARSAMGGTAGKLAFATAGTSQKYTLTNAVASTSFVFGNPTMGYLDIWSFIDDNGLQPQFDYMGANNTYTDVTRETAMASANVLTNPMRYLPPMHAIVVATAEELSSHEITIDKSHIVTAPVTSPSPAPHRAGPTGRSRGIMTVTAVNPVSPRCMSRMLLGQGYHAEVLNGEDAMLTTVNINNYTNTSAPATPFNIYSSEGDYGLSINLRDEVLNVPVSFYMSELPYDPVTHLWFTGVNNIDGQLVLYDALTDTERLILDGICLDIPTPESSHLTRYYIRRRGFDPGNPDLPITTTVEDPYGNDAEASATKIIQDGHVFILRDGHVYTLFGQKIR